MKSMRPIGVLVAAAALSACVGVASARPGHEARAARHQAWRQCPHRQELNEVAITGLHPGGCDYGRAVERAVMRWLRTDPQHGSQMRASDHSRPTPRARGPRDARRLQRGTPLVPTQVAVPIDRRELARRPKGITYSGDGSAFIAGPRDSTGHAMRIRWRSWGRHDAAGTGANWLDNCTPDCATGGFSVYPAALRLSRPRMLGGYLLFTRMKLTYTASHPPAEGGAETFRLHFVAGEPGYLW
jgi:hypothetical protein